MPHCHPPAATRPLLLVCLALLSQLHHGICGEADDGKWALGDLSAERTILLPVVVTKAMISERRPIDAAFAVNAATTVAVSVLDKTGKALASAKPEKAAPERFLLAKAGVWSAVKEPGTYAVAFTVKDTKYTSLVFTEVALLSLAKGKPLISRMDVKPNEGAAFTVEYKLTAASKVKAEYAHSDKPGRPHLIRDHGERAAGTDHEIGWKADVEKGMYLLRVTAAPVAGSASPEVRAKPVKVKK